MATACWISAVLRLRLEIFYASAVIDRVANARSALSCRAHWCTMTFDLSTSKQPQVDVRTRVATTAFSVSEPTLLIDPDSHSDCLWTKRTCFLWRGLLGGRVVGVPGCGCIKQRTTWQRLKPTTVVSSTLTFLFQGVWSLRGIVRPQLHLFNHRTLNMTIQIRYVVKSTD